MLGRVYLLAALAVLITGVFSLPTPVSDFTLTERDSHSATVEETLNTVTNTQAKKTAYEGAQDACDKKYSKWCAPPKARRDVIPDLPVGGVPSPLDTARGNLPVHPPVGV